MTRLCLSCGAVYGSDGSVEYPFPVGEPVPVVPGAVELSECLMCEGDDKYVRTLPLAFPSVTRHGRAAA